VVPHPTEVNTPDARQAKARIPPSRPAGSPR